MFSSKVSQRGDVIIPLLILVVIVGAGLMGGGFSGIGRTVEEPTPTPHTVANVVPQQQQPATQEDAIQLQAINFTPITSAPNPTSRPQVNRDFENQCAHDTGTPAEVNSGRQVENPSCFCGAFLMKCRANKCTELINGGGFQISDGPPGTYPCGEKITDNGPDDGFDAKEWQDVLDRYCANIEYAAEGDGTYCIGKPIIYLYPEVDTLVDVEVKTAGKIFISDPLYPVEDGWKNVLAKPDGTFTYEGEQYRELFYESEVNEFIKPQNGIIIARSELAKKLPEIIYQIGLNEWETREFTDWWIPRLHDLNSNYVLFSLIEKDSKEKIDKVIVNPEPDTRIEFIAYFKPLDVLSSIEPLVLPNRPERVGFTMVEWGGILDNNPINKSLK